MSSMWDKPRLTELDCKFFVCTCCRVDAVRVVVCGGAFADFSYSRSEGGMDSYAHVNREQMKLIVAKHLKGNFFTLDLIKTRDAFEKLPWARNVSVRRRWPDKLRCGD